MDPIKIISLFCFFLLLRRADSLGLKSPKSEISPFMQAHHCEVESTTRVTNGFARYVMLKMFCKGLTPSTFWNATCDERCRDPVKRKPLSKKLYKVEPVTIFSTFNSASDGKVEEKITLSCRCVAVEKKKRKRHGRGRKGQGSQQH